MSVALPKLSAAERPASVLDKHATLWDWRRRVFDLYAQIRAMPDPEAAARLWQETRKELFRGHPQTPLDEGGALPSYFAYDPTLRFEVALAPPRNTTLHHMPVGRDGVVNLTPFATTDGLAAPLGGELTLYWIEGYGGGTFLPFLDATSGAASYGGGRYLLDTIKGADLGQTPDGRLILDFNFAYSPSCVYSPRWVCPLAPSANRLPAPIAAGERIA